MPNGNYVTPPTLGPITKRGKRISIVAVRKAEPDPAQVVKALIAIAIELAEQQGTQD